MSQPDFVPLHTGDVHDDDAQVIDRFLNDSTEPPDPWIEPIEIPVYKEVELPTRLIGGDQLIGSTWAPVQLLPADPNRLFLSLSVFSAAGVPSAATDWVVLADEKGKPCGKLRHGQTLDLAKHTGPVWADPASSTSSCYVSYWSTTK